MDDVVFGYVYDFGSGEEWVAERGKGALLNGADLGPIFPKEEIEILSFEATLTSSVAEKAAVDGRRRLPAADHGLARALALPPRGRARRRGLLAQGRALGRHRRRAAAGARARPRDRPAGGAAVRRRRRSTSRAARAASQPRRRRSASASSPRCRREAGPDRLLGLELRALAERRLLSAEAAAAALARLLRAPLRHGRDQRDLLPPAARDRSRELGARVPAGVRFRGEDEPLRDAHQAPARPAAEHRALLRADPAAGRVAEARARAMAAAAGLSPRRRAARRGAGAAAGRAALLRVPRRRAGSSSRSTSCCALTASRS